MSVLDSINSLSDDIKTMQALLDEHGISYKNDIGYPLDDVAIISDYIDELEIENQRIRFQSKFLMAILNMTAIRDCNPLPENFSISASC